MANKSSIIKRAITTDGSARVIFCDSTEIVKRSCEIHRTAKTATAVIGRSLTAAAMMGSLLKDKNDSLTLRIDGDGPAGTIVCVSDYMGNVRGYMDNPDVELSPNDKGKLDVGGAVGKGTVYVIRDMGLKEPYVGMAPIISGEIAEDITNYYASSEQTPTVCALGVRVDRDNMCYAAGGYLLQLMPGAEESIIGVLEKNIMKMKSISSLIAEGTCGEEIIAQILSDIDFEMFDEFDIGYKCPCCRGKYLNALAGLPEDDIKEICGKNEPVETSCMFCEAKYTFTPEEILEERKKKTN